MKKGIITIIILILCVFIICLNSNEVNAATLSSIVEEYYFGGVYTKKSNIYLTSAAVNDLQNYFHGEVAKDRTTYYNSSYLLMGDLDGGFDEINSGYRNSGKNMNHFTLVDGIVVDDYSVSNTDIHTYYVTLKKMKDTKYFNSSWINGEYTVTSSNDKYLADFLAFTAPCLTDYVFNSHYITDVGIKLTISEQKHLVFGEYLSMKMYVNALDKGKVGNDLVLSEARIYKGNYLFDESSSENGLTSLKEELSNINNNYIVNTNVYFNDLALQRVESIFGNKFYSTMTTMVNNNYLFRYSDDFGVNEAYYNLNNNLYKTSLKGSTLDEKINSSIDINDSELILENAGCSDYFFMLEELNSSYIDKYGPTTIKYTSSYSKEYLGWVKTSSNVYRCDHPDVIEDFMNLCMPTYTNGGTYLTFRYVTVEFTDNVNNPMILRLYVSPTQIGKIVQGNTSSLNYKNYLLIAEAFVFNVGNVSIDALENLYN